MTDLKLNKAEKWVISKAIEVNIKRGQYNNWRFQRISDLTYKKFENNGSYIKIPAEYRRALSDFKYNQGNIGRYWYDQEEEGGN